MGGGATFKGKTCVKRETEERSWIDPKESHRCSRDRAQAGHPEEQMWPESVRTIRDVVRGCNTKLRVTKEVQKRWPSYKSKRKNMRNVMYEPCLFCFLSGVLMRVGV